MKCLRNPVTGELKRVHDHEARKMASYGWLYVTKGEYKRTVRPKPWLARPAAAEIVDRMPFVSGLPADEWRR